jgi:AcrR family transcriptional regulator
MNCPANFNKRSEKTRRQITSAFTGLVFANGFENVSVLEVVAAAKVARSTFYEHFSGKEDVLRVCMSRFFAVIAECVARDTAPAELTRVLNHLWDNRRLTDAVFSGVPRVILARALSEMVEAHLRGMNQGAPLALSYRLAAIHPRRGAAWPGRELDAWPRLLRDGGAGAGFAQEQPGIGRGPARGLGSV